MSHFSSEGDSDVESGQERGFGQVTKLPLQGEHRHVWGTGNHPVQLGFRDLTSPEEASECDRSPSENEMGFIARGTLIDTRKKDVHGARQEFSDLPSTDDEEGPLFMSKPAAHGVEASSLPLKHQEEYGIGYLNVDPVHDNAKYTQQVPEEDRWRKANQSTAPLEQPFVGDLDQPQSLGEYNPPPSVGEYPGPPSVGEYSQPPSVGEYSQPPSVGPSSRSSVTSASRGKEWDVFVSHSTGDKPWAREKVIVPLRNPPLSLKVSGSYHFMPDETRYDNKGIESALRKSAVVIIGLSPPYLKSERCSKEWQLVSRLYHEGQCRVIVGAVQPCNRPEQLKRHLYLDYVNQDKERRENVWKKLVTTLKEYLDIEGGMQVETGHSDKVEWGEGHKKEETQAGTFTRGERSAGREGKGLSESTDEEEEEEEEEEEGEEGEEEEGNMSQGVPDIEEIFKGFEESPYVTYATPMDRMSSYTFHASTQAVPSNSTDGEAKQVESGSEEGEIADGEDQQEGEAEEVGTASHAVNVARHYNALEAPNVEKRKESPIFHLRNFNNWVKSVLIRTYLGKVARHASVLDLCCGKGGDLLKWKEGGISHLVCADIAETSVQQCRERYHSDKVWRRNSRDPPFEAEFIVADCSRVRLRDEYMNAGMRFNLTSCQFSVHYSFESQPQAHMMLRNACENLRPGGYFIGTTVDSSELVHRVRTSKNGSIGNDIFSVTPRIDVWKHIPLFGAKYDFKLHGVVDLPEYLVYFPLLVEMLKDFNMEHICHQNFYDFFTEHRNNSDDVDLMYKMQAMDRETGTMSQDEWEAIGLYMVFVFQKAGGSRGGGSSSASDTRPHKRPKHYQQDY